MTIKEMFEPYMLFITIFITFVLNAYLIVKGANWFVFVVANILFMLLQGFLGLEEYNLLLQIFNFLKNLIADLVSSILEGLLGGEDSIFAKAWKWIKDLF